MKTITIDHEIFPYFYYTNPQAIFPTIYKFRYPNLQFLPIYLFAEIQFFDQFKTFSKKERTLLGINRLNLIFHLILKYYQ